MGRIGIITYDVPHLKTRQVMGSLLENNLEDNYKVYMLPFKKRKKRKILFKHRPDQIQGESTEDFCKRNKLEYIYCTSDLEIKNDCDKFLILGAGIISEQAIEGKRIINCHPGIIPIARGLDAFKWSIYNGYPLGVTLHYIDKEADSGEVIAVRETQVYANDALETLACRHYKNEIDMLADYKQYLLENVDQRYENAQRNPPQKRMPYDKEQELEKKFILYKEQYACGSLWEEACGKRGYSLRRSAYGKKSSW